MLDCKIRAPPATGAATTHMRLVLALAVHAAPTMNMVVVVE
jgi:hypothetical protein